MLKTSDLLNSRLFLSPGPSGQYCVIDKDCLRWSTVYTRYSLAHTMAHTMVYTNYRSEDGYDRCGLLITDLALALTDVCSVTLHNNY